MNKEITKIDTKIENKVAMIKGYQNGQAPSRHSEKARMGKLGECSKGSDTPRHSTG